MTETTDTTEFEEFEGTGDIPLDRVQISFIINFEDIGSLGEALDSAAIALGRSGLSAFYLHAIDPDTDRQWIIQDGEIIDAKAASEELMRLREAEDLADELYEDRNLPPEDLQSAEDASDQE